MEVETDHMDVAIAHTEFVIAHIAPVSTHVEVAMSHTKDATVHIAPVHRTWRL